MEGRQLEGYCILMNDAERVVTRACVVASLLLFTAGAASAGPAPVITNLNLRQGPSTDFGNAGDWCNVTFGDRGGYVLARNLDMREGAPVAVEPGPVTIEPPVVVGRSVYYYGGPRYWGPRYYGGWGWRRHY